MANRVLDTNVLIRPWRGQLLGLRRVDSEASAQASAAAWLRLPPDEAIVTPVRVEFLAGTESRDELRLADVFVSHFPLLDGGRVLPQDWDEAERYARRVPFDGRRRGALDCLIRAICDRLHADMYTGDTGFPRR